MNASKETVRKGFGMKSKYVRITSPQTRREFNVWWDEHKENWKFNTRYIPEMGILSIGIARYLFFKLK